MSKDKQRLKTKYNIGEAKALWYELFDRVVAGETITIARRGKPVGKLKPYRSRRKASSIASDA